MRLTRRARALKDLDRDIRDHIETETQDNIERGMPPEEARWAALRKFGAVTRVTEDTREVWTAVWLQQLMQDVRYGFRMLTRQGLSPLISLRDMEVSSQEPEVRVHS